MTKRRTPERYTNSIEPPLYQSASYYYDDFDHVEVALHKRTLPAGRYGRYSNPTWLDVEDRLSRLSGSERSLIFSSGMAAIFTTFIALLKAGDEIAVPAESYRRTRDV